jgi:hypothetical protein
MKAFCAGQTRGVKKKRFRILRIPHCDSGHPTITPGPHHRFLEACRLSLISDQANS